MAEVYLSIGSNINRHKNIHSCLQQLQADFPDVVFSKIYETPAEGFDGSPFFNLAAKHTTKLSPQALDKHLKAIEDQHARARDRKSKKFSSRTLDIDLLLYDQENLHPQMDVPRDEIVHYPFVLFPLAEIAPNVTHPTLQKSIAELAKTSALKQDTLVEITLKKTSL
ncbi:MAG: 2-amino-4-hydroxy-6-hydroxymethyldihydropteridinepyrophosphokinase (EC [uncultured Thiotrichaceae bacterium]|uniref:2-amino-4-hydroxy-6-hydroxymethyldihydropteridine diphosphokinase n=1 Tax=uncultured Thiotrichaceae bacterium TaxID=298394 RepID=A0A6S6UDT3_9GAMM|nr:MAG: 2-amino-4-hydroxy-6-hydroxymethyldihydropteridinepyrophosphokinase (EC [uncultured Thiotrichaceae bacterium]